MDTDGRVAFLVRGLRTRTLLRCANDANDLRLVWVTAREVRRRHQHLLGSGVWKSVLGSTTFTEADLDDAAVREVAGVTGLSLHRAGVWIGTADRLCGSMPRVVQALAAGRLDLARATTVADECTGLTEDQVRVVEAAVLAALPPEALEGTAPVGPWDVMAPRAFTAMVKKAVAGVRTDTDDAIANEVRERTGTWLEIDQANPALATWTITGPTEQLVAAEEACAATVRGMTREELGGRTHGITKVDLITDALLTGGGDGLGTVSVVRREVGVVIHLDTLDGHGDAKDAAGEVRGTGHPVPVTAAVARVLAADALARGAGTCVLLADDTGHLTRVLRVGTGREKGWTRETLIEAARAALRRQPQPRHHTDSYAPTVEIADTVAARDPVCTFPGCGVPTGRCDLDHLVPHPRGPTAVHNLSPRSRRCHRLKTAALWRCRTRRSPSGAVIAHEWTSPLGHRQVVEVTTLPGC